jgi:hypothetical protein
MTVRLPQFAVSLLTALECEGEALAAKALIHIKEHHEEIKPIATKL